MTATTKTVIVNYTAEQAAMMVEMYTANPTKDTVEKLAEKLGKTVKSVVAKLVREKVYKKAEYVSKSGEKVQLKNEYADAIGAVLKMNENDIDSLTKCNKTALAIIFKAIANSVPLTPENDGIVEPEFKSEFNADFDEGFEE